MTGGDLETAAEAVKTESRRYAKRQLSWFKRDKKHTLARVGERAGFAAGLRFSTEYWYKLVTMKPSNKKLKETAKYDTIVSPSQKERTAHHVKNTEFAGYLSQSARTNKQQVTIFLVNGFQLRGVVTGFDSFTVVLDSEGKQQMIYKHAISTIIPSRNISLMTGGES
jgi:host factor-I protein